MSTKQSELRSLGRRINGVTMPIRCKRIKWSRNFPCLCGSGIKYKRCCMNEIDGLTARDGNAVVDELSKDVQKMIAKQQAKFGKGGIRHYEEDSTNHRNDRARR